MKLILLFAITFYTVCSLGAQPPVDEGSDYYRLTYDIGFSTGSVGSTNYSEGNVGLNYFLKRWFSLRSALFGRFISPENIYGLDLSGRFFYDVSFGKRSGMTFFGGPGYRFVTLGDNVPFIEGGLVTHLGSFSIGAGLKTFYNNAVRSGAPQDTQYFLILAGGGAL